jgi:hypothetical protein
METHRFQPYWTVSWPMEVSTRYVSSLPAIPLVHPE